MDKLMRKGVFYAVAIIAAFVLQPQKAQARLDVGISFQVFYDNLSPYGRWVDDRSYGRIWIPDCGSDFQPYATNGHWIQTPYGNTWVSDYSWGWAPFHYGRWFYDDYYGWAWIPGNEWGPGWVSWRSGGGYYGWAPMGPSVSISINIPIARWIFVPQRYFCEPNIYRYRVYGNSGVNIYRNTTVINNYYTYNNRRYQAGPRFDEIRRVTNRPVRVYDVRDNDRPGRMEVGRDRVNIYRPNIERKDNDRGPSRVAENRPDNRYNGRPGNRNDSNNRNNDRNDRPDNNNRGGINWQMGSGNQAQSNVGNQRPDRSGTQRDGNNQNATPGTINNDRANTRDRRSAEQAQQQRAEQQRIAEQQRNTEQQRIEQQRNADQQRTERQQRAEQQQRAAQQQREQQQRSEQSRSQRSDNRGNSRQEQSRPSERTQQRGGEGRSSSGRPGRG
jgi:hypothetical protein